MPPIALPSFTLKFAKRADFKRFMKWQPTPAFLPGDLLGQRSLAGHSSWGHQESEMTEKLTHTRKIKSTKGRLFQ